MQRFAKDTEFDAVLPALGNKGVRFKVFYSAALPDFATWRATRAGQGFDARTFEVKARPAAPIAGARPGMSVLVLLAFYIPAICALGALLADVAGALTVLAALATLAGLLLLRLARPRESKAHSAI